MQDPLTEQLRGDMVCEGVLECVYGRNRLERECFTALVESDEPLTVDEIAERVDRERSTAYRSIQRLLDDGVVRRDQIDYESGGYYHVYYPADPEDIADEMRRRLNDRYARMGQLIRKFEAEYGDGDRP